MSEDLHSFSYYRPRVHCIKWNIIFVRGVSFGSGATWNPSHNPATIRLLTNDPIYEDEDGDEKTRREISKLEDAPLRYAWNATL